MCHHQRRWLPMLDAGQVVRSTIRHSLVVIPVHVLVAGEQEPEGSGWIGIRLPRGLPRRWHRAPRPWRHPKPVGGLARAGPSRAPAVRLPGQPRAGHVRSRVGHRAGDRPNPSVGSLQARSQRRVRRGRPRTRWCGNNTVSTVDVGGARKTRSVERRCGVPWSRGARAGPADVAAARWRVVRAPAASPLPSFGGGFGRSD